MILANLCPICLTPSHGSAVCPEDERYNPVPLTPKPELEQVMIAKRYFDDLHAALSDARKSANKYQTMVDDIRAAVYAFPVSFDPNTPPTASDDKVDALIAVNKIRRILSREF